MECLDKGAQYCSYCSVCSQRSVWEEAQQVLTEFLARRSIADMADGQGLKNRLVNPRMQQVG
jgi:DNA-binding IscR family transcriptional regulator